MNIQHKELAEGRWAEMSLCEQMANIGSEVNRAINWKKKGKEGFSKKAVNRALELLNLSAQSTVKYPQLKELLRVKEALIDFFYESNNFSSSDLAWQKYFNHFNYAVRKNY